MMQKTLLLLSFFFIMLQSVVAQTSQKGIVYEYTGQKTKKPLSGVYVTASGSTAVSDKNGRFTLKFNTLKKGDRISVNQISKKGYVVMKSDDLNMWVVSNDGKLIEVLMCLSEQKEDLLMLYFNLANKSHENQLKQNTKENKRLKADNQIDKEEYGQRQAELTRQYNQSISQSEELADFFSSLDVTKISESSSKAVELLSEGHVEEAAAMVHKSQNIFHLRQLTEIQCSKGQLKKDQQAKKLKLISSVVTDINVLLLCGGKANTDTCAYYWQEVVKADPNNPENLRHAVNFMLQYSRYKEAEPMMAFLLEASKTDDDKFDYYRLASHFQEEMNNDDEAERLCRKAVELGKSLAADQSELHLIDYCKSLVSR